MMAFGVTAEQVKKKRKELDCSLQRAQLECEREAAQSIITRKFLMNEEVSDEELFDVFNWLIERA